MSRVSRRTFVQGSVALAAGIAGEMGLGRTSFAANDKIHVACIGVRGRGNSVMQSFAAEPDCVVTHICDVNESVRTQRGEEMKQRTGVAPKLVNDFHDLMNDSTIDVFMVGTPDHWHALLTIYGCMAGKDVYVEKPASHNIVEGKAAVAASRKFGRMVQVGTQIRSAPFLKEAADYVRSGGLGKVIYGKAWETDRNSAVKLQPNGAAPAGFDYDLWQGPAPERPYNPTIVGGAWRWLFDYGTGDLGNDGVHRIDYCRYVMGIEELPQSISCSGGKFFFTDDDQQWPDTMLVNYEYSEKILQYEMRLWSRPKLMGATEGAAVYGENGWIQLTNSSWTAYDAAGKVVQKGESNSGQIQQAHIRNFLDAVRSRRRESLNQEVESGHISSLMCHAGNIAWRSGKKLKLDPATQSFDDPAANQYLGREHRRGFELPREA